MTMKELTDLLRDGVIDYNQYLSYVEIIES